MNSAGIPDAQTPHLSFTFIDPLIYPLWIYKHRICEGLGEGQRWRRGDDMASDGGYISPRQKQDEHVETTPSWLKWRKRVCVCLYVSAWCVNSFCSWLCFSPSSNLCWGIRWSIRQRWATPGLVSARSLSLSHTHNTHKHLLIQLSYLFKIYFLLNVCV